VQRQVLRPRFQRDDHVNPALLRLPDGRALALYSKHGGAEMYARSTLRPHDASEWTPERILQLHGEGAEAQARKRKTITYPNPVLLSGEDNRIWALLARGRLEAELQRLRRSRQDVERCAHADLPPRRRLGQSPLRQGRVQRRRHDPPGIHRRAPA
jgi:hypothetical protein